MATADEGNKWVQCDDCQQWRNLPGCTKEEYEEVQGLQRWTCSMNVWDKSKASCSHPEEAEETVRMRGFFTAEEEQMPLQSMSKTFSLVKQSKTKMVRKASRNTSGENQNEDGFPFSASMTTGFNSKDVMSNLDHNVSSQLWSVANNVTLKKEDETQAASGWSSSSRWKTVTKTSQAINRLRLSQSSPNLEDASLDAEFDHDLDNFSRGSSLTRLRPRRQSKTLVSAAGTIPQRRFQHRVCKNSRRRIPLRNRGRGRPHASLVKDEFWMNNGATDEKLVFRNANKDSLMSENEWEGEEASNSSTVWSPSTRCSVKRPSMDNNSETATSLLEQSVIRPFAAAHNDNKHLKLTQKNVTADSMSEFPVGNQVADGNVDTTRKAVLLDYYRDPNIPCSWATLAPSDTTKKLLIATTIRWVQCDLCQKWRRLPGCSEVEYEHLTSSETPWVCSMNCWDQSRASCAAPEEVVADTVGTTSSAPPLSCQFDLCVDVGLASFARSIVQSLLLNDNDDNTVGRLFPRKVYPLPTTLEDEESLLAEFSLTGFPWHTLPSLMLHKIYFILYTEERLRQNSTKSMTSGPVGFDGQNQEAEIISAPSVEDLLPFRSALHCCILSHCLLSIPMFFDILQRFSAYCLSIITQNQSLENEYKIKDKEENEKVLETRAAVINLFRRLSDIDLSQSLSSSSLSTHILLDIVQLTKMLKTTELLSCTINDILENSGILVSCKTGEVKISNKTMCSGSYSLCNDNQTNGATSVPVSLVFDDPPSLNLHPLSKRMFLCGRSDVSQILVSELLPGIASLQLPSSFKAAKTLGAVGSGVLSGSNAFNAIAASVSASTSPVALLRDSENASKLQSCVVGFSAAPGITTKSGYVSSLHNTVSNNNSSSTSNCSWPTSSTTRSATSARPLLHAILPNAIPSEGLRLGHAARVPWPGIEELFMSDIDNDDDEFTKTDDKHFGKSSLNTFSSDEEDDDDNNEKKSCLVDSALPKQVVHDSPNIAHNDGNSNMINNGHFSLPSSNEIFEANWLDKLFPATSNKKSREQRLYCELHKLSRVLLPDFTINNKKSGYQNEKKKVMLTCQRSAGSRKNSSKSIVKKNNLKCRLRMTKAFIRQWVQHHQGNTLPLIPALRLVDSKLSYEQLGSPPFVLPPQQQTFRRMERKNGLSISKPTFGGGPLVNRNNTNCSSLINSSTPGLTGDTSIITSVPAVATEMSSLNNSKYVSSSLASPRVSTKGWRSALKPTDNGTNTSSNITMNSMTSTSRHSKHSSINILTTGVGSTNVSNTESSPTPLILNPVTAGINSIFFPLNNTLKDANNILITPFLQYQQLSSHLTLKSPLALSAGICLVNGPQLRNIRGTTQFASHTRVSRRQQLQQNINDFTQCLDYFEKKCAATLSKKEDFLNEHHETRVSPTTPTVKNQIKFSGKTTNTKKKLQQPVSEGPTNNIFYTTTMNSLIPADDVADSIFITTRLDHFIQAAVQSLWLADLIFFSDADVLFHNCPNKKTTTIVEPNE